MDTGYYRYHAPYGKHHGPGQESRGPAVFFGYCSDSGTMRMMDYAEYVDSMRTASSNMYSSMAGTMQTYMDTMLGKEAGRHHHHKSDCHCCGGYYSKGHGYDKYDCHCSCCIKCADAVEYARCGESRQIPITLDNDSRRERDVKLQLGGFSTASGQDLGWQTKLSETEFKLPPCGEKIILLRVDVDCGKFVSSEPHSPPGSNAPTDREPSVDECKVAYTTLRAEGCFIRPLVIAVAVLPNDCGAHYAGCQCACCCC